MIVETVDTLQGMRQLREEYQAVAESCQASPFTSWEWMYHWWATAAAGHGVRMLAFRDEHGQFEGVLPLMQVRYGFRRLGLREIRFASDCVLASPTYISIVARPGREQACLRAGFAWLAEEPGWDRLELGRLRARGSTLGLLCRAAAEQGLRAEIRPSTWCRHITLPHSYEEYLMGLSRHRRRAVRKYRREAQQRHAVAFHRCPSREAIPELLALHFRFKAANMSGKVAWTQVSDPSYHAFVCRLAEELWDRQQLWLWYLEAEGKPAGVSFGIVSGGTCYFKSYSYDPRFVREDFGQLMMGYTIEQCITESLQVCDLLSTEYDYKTRYAAGRALVAKLTVYRPRLRSLCYEAMAHALALSGGRRRGRGPAIRAEEAREEKR